MIGNIKSVLVSSPVLGILVITCIKLKLGLMMLPEVYFSYLYGACSSLESLQINEIHSPSPSTVEAFAEMLLGIFPTYFIDIL